MRHRSKTNSRPHENINLRRAYVESNPECELSPVLRGCRMKAWSDIWDAWIPWNSVDVQSLPVEPNHIFSMGSRPDVTSNLISVCRPAHDWFHKYLVEGRIACLYVKAVVKNELNPTELLGAFGQNVDAWLERQATEHEHFDRLRRETVRFLRSAAV